MIEVGEALIHRRRTLHPEYVGKWKTLVCQILEKVSTCVCGSRQFDFKPDRVGATVIVKPDEDSSEEAWALACHKCAERTEPELLAGPCKDLGFRPRILMATQT